MDILPTFAGLSGGKVPHDRVIDGHDISPLIHGQRGVTSPTKAFFYYQHTHLQAVRCGKWKLHLPRPANPSWTPDWARHIDPQDVFEIKKPMLFDLEKDVSEQDDVADTDTEVVKKLLELAEWARNDIGDYNRIGKNARFFDPQPPRPDVAKWKPE
jgi:arylsulfatase A-like enzyme